MNFIFVFIEKNYPVYLIKYDPLSLTKNTNLTTITVHQLDSIIRITEIQ